MFNATGRINGHAPKKEKKKRKRKKQSRKYDEKLDEGYSEMSFQQFQRNQMRLVKRLLQQFRGHMFVEKLKYYERFRPYPISLKMYLGFGQEGTVEISFKFLQKELLVRLANISKEIDSLLQNLPQLSSTTDVCKLFYQSFEDLLPFENAEPTDDNISSFNEKLETVMMRHENTIEEMAEGIVHILWIDFILIRYLYEFCSISIKIIVLISVIIFGTLLPASPRHIGCIDPACDVAAVIVDAYDSARFVCDGCYCDSPKLQFDSYNSVAPGQPIAIAAIPSHLYHIMFELFKNSMRATVDHYGEFEKLPPIQVLATLGEEDLTVRISDSGGGIPRRKMNHLFQYSYTTALPPASGGHNAALAGYGYGLPLSRLYARYFHGDLMVTSMEGYGTDAFLYIKAVPFKASETIPRYSTSSRNNSSPSPIVSQPSDVGILELRHYNVHFNKKHANRNFKKKLQLTGMGNFNENFEIQ
uniref:Protein-serine/threonine kinase n=1 Tax=Wuchereria bancrofti TaxID=6293 RepID=A0A1I8E961_WUCBA